MKAASGVIHSEMPQQSEGLMRGFQLWINLPGAQKMTDPVYQEFSPAAIPVVETGGARVRVVSGRFEQANGPVEDPHTGVRFLDLEVFPDQLLSLPLDASGTGLIYVFEGSAGIDGTPLRTHELAVLGEGERVEVQAGEAGARAILIAGRPLDEPVVQYGPFVMNSIEEIEQAFEDLREGRLVRKRGDVVAA
jgi:redox-sensitive bicupin YhaK (pirin superfamily)